MTLLEQGLLKEESDLLLLTITLLKFIDKEGYYDSYSDSFVEDSEDEYVPSTASSNSSDSEMSMEIPLQTCGKIVISNCKKNVGSDTVEDHEDNYVPSKNSIEIPPQSCSKVSISNSMENDGINTGINQNIKVDVSKKSEFGRRIWDKKHYCLFCKKQYPKLARHLEQMHYNELDVKKALAFPKKSKERKAAWRDLMNQGDFSHNAHVLSNQNGIIIPYKRPSKAMVENRKINYVQCDTCLGTFVSGSLWRHVKNCHPQNREKKSKIKKYHQVSCAALLPVSSAAGRMFQQVILHKMANDSISLLARNDFDIVCYGQKLFQKFMKNPHQYQYVRQKMRELGRFVEEIRAIDKTVVNLRDCIDAQKFTVCVQAVRNLCGYIETNMTFKIPSVAKKLGHSLHKVARQVKTAATKNLDLELKEKAINFIEVYLDDWEAEVSHATIQTLEIKKYNKATRILLANDLKLITGYLQKQADMLMEIFESTQASEIEWRELCEVTEAQTLLFNKKRSGEIERLEVEQYLNGIQHGKTIQEEILQSLSPLEKKLSEVVDKVELRGKRGRRVAILIPSNLRKQLDTLLKNRHVGGIDANNKYMFARPRDSEFPVRATDVLRKFANSCGAKKPELLTSTLFRKHVAVIVQMLNLKENELDVLANFLGHDIRVHREFYRLPQDTIQVAKVSKLLMELERGNIHKYKGKSLDEIEFDLEEPLEEENSDVEDSSQKTPIDVPMTKKDITRNKCRGRKLWSANEEAAVKKSLGKYFLTSKLIGKLEIEDARKKHPELSNRTWVQIKSFIKNTKVSKKRMMTIENPQ